MVLLLINPRGEIKAMVVVNAVFRRKLRREMRSVFINLSYYGFLKGSY